MKRRNVVPFIKKKKKFNNLSNFKTAEQFFSEYKVKKLTIPEQFANILQDKVVFKNYVSKHNVLFLQANNLQLRSDAEKISIANSLLSCDKSLLRLLNWEVFYFSYTYNKFMHKIIVLLKSKKKGDPVYLPSGFLPQFYNYYLIFDYIFILLSDIACQDSFFKHLDWPLISRFIGNLETIFMQNVEFFKLLLN